MLIIRGFDPACGPMLFSKCLEGVFQFLSHAKTLQPNALTLLSRIISHQPLAQREKDHVSVKCLLLVNVMQNVSPIFDLYV